MTTWEEQLAQFRIVPVAVIERPEDARPVAQALKAGGLPCLEVTFRTAAAVEALACLAEDRDLLLGAGTVLRTSQVDEAVDAGARFIVTPGFNHAVVGRCQQRGVPVLPGVATPTEIQVALDAGIDVVKFFPAGPLGGPAMLRALTGVYRGVRFVPTGGVTAANITDYLSVPGVLCVGTSWMLPADMITAGRFDEIRTRTAQLVALAQGAGS